MAEPRIDVDGLPFGVSGPYDTVVGVDEATGEARRFPMPQPGTPRSYATRASLPAASGFAEGYTVWVNNDPTPANNGTWAVLGGTWVKSADRVTGLEGRVGGVEQDVEAVEDALSRVAAMRDSTPGNIEVLEDDIGMVVRRTDAAGEVFLPNIADGVSVQSAIGDLQSRSSAGSGVRPRDVLAILDADDNVLFRMDHRGAFYLPGSVQPVQAAAGMTLSPTNFPRTDRENLHDSVKPLMADLLAEARTYIPPPTVLVPNRYDVPDGFISAFSVSQGEGIVLETPYAPGGLVHPHLIEMRVPLLGYRYILGETPHKSGNAREENPIIYGSNDLRSFDLIPDVPQPLGYGPPNPSGYNSDIAWTYDPRDGRLIAVWRSVSGAERRFHYRSTYDGLTWSKEVSFLLPLGSEWLSPAILYEPASGLWHLWVVWTEGRVTHLTGPSEMGPWTVEGSQSLLADFGINVWHIEVKWLGSRFAILANAYGVNSNLWLGLSSDGNAWEMGPGLISPQVPYVYKGTFLPEFDGARVRVHIAWNTYVYPLPAGMVDAFHMTTSNWLDLTSEEN